MLTVEVTTPHVHAWIEAAPADSLYPSDWVLTEVSSALALKERTGRLALDERTGALDLFTRFCDAACHFVPILPAHFRRATRLVDASVHGLRGPDALHLALVEAHQLQLLTFDVSQTQAARGIGVDVIAPA